MTTKYRLIYSYNNHPSFNISWVRSIIDQTFELVQYEPGTRYAPGRDFALVTYASKVEDKWYLDLQKQGCGVIVDHLWDSDVAIKSHCTDTEMELRCPNWMWYLACIEFSHHGYESYRPARKRRQALLMLMNNPRWHRDWLLHRLDQVLPQCLYSYNSKDIKIANDMPEDYTNVPWQRYLNPDWYDNTAFSVVAESYMRNSWHPATMRTEVSEKIFKPLAFFHPFVCAGSVDTLKYLKNQGFVTYDNWFDESYDSIEDDHIRLATVGRVAWDAAYRWINNELEWDAETERRAEHNHYHMFNQRLVMDRLHREIIEPVLEFCECYVR